MAEESSSKFTLDITRKPANIGRRFLYTIVVKHSLTGTGCCFLLYEDSFCKIYCWILPFVKISRQCTCSGNKNWWLQRRTLCYSNHLFKSSNIIPPWRISCNAKNHPIIFMKSVDFENASMLLNRFNNSSFDAPKRWCLFYSTLHINPTFWCI